MPALHYTRQGPPKVLGHAVLAARHYVQNQPFAVLLPDEMFTGASPALVQVMEHWSPATRHIVGLQKVLPAEVSRYPIAALRNGSEAFRLWQLADLVEKPAVPEAPSRLAMIGRYILRPEIFDRLESPPGRRGSARR